MKNNIFLSIWILFLLISCSEKVITISSVREKLNVQFKKLNDSKVEKNIKLVAGVYRNKKVRVITPKDKNGSKPLIIALHWAGKDVFTQYSQCLVEPAFKDLDCYIIIPDAEEMLWTNSYNENKIIRLIALAKKNWKIDATKIVVTGYSNGGNGAWFFADKYPNLISAAIPIASAYKITTKIKTPLYVIHGEKDRLFPINNTRKWIDLSRESGSNIVFKAIPNYSHFMACNYVFELKKAVVWLNY